MGPIYYILIALPCTIGAIALALVHIYRHLLNYTEPTYQRYIVRIIFMVPVYALMSFLSLVLNKNAIYFNSIREIYEAWVIYNFLSLCLAWVGGPGAVVLNLSGRVLKPNWYLMMCCFPPIPLDGRFIRRCKQGCLQFVILKPILVAVTFILYAKQKYEDGNFSPKQSYLYLTIIYTISYSTALYALVLFYVACRDLLQPFNPVPKFIIIKSVVFLTYWQGVLVFLAAKARFIKDTEEAAEFQNFIICVEMLIAAAGHLFAFPYKEYAGANVGPSHGFWASLGHALKLNDFYHDTVHQFAPTYHDYVLYNHNEGDEGAKKYRARTFVPTGTEMDTARKNKKISANKLEYLQLSSLSSSASSTSENAGIGCQTGRSEAVNSSLLIDTSSVSLSHDLSLIDVDLTNYPPKVSAANVSGTS
ncbi:PREDICTED: transmembrane protein 184A-like [Nicotiana attenuata]|uniref:Protein laz1 -like 1 n=1 Tax=Nicotiana attenuata TaxID=49451 RepID=A0A1J6IHU0_NICAT|nr:PREDICTED: transmembrane protein 184A-like [Nicotiana attenuata]OIT04438.1 protein laz1 -like 1 [Nicotiana attenuata]